MKPYYEHGGVTIYHGDCREVLPRLPAGAVVITDQPYGTGWVRGGGRRAGEFHARHERPAWDVFDLSWMWLLKTPKRVAAFYPVSRQQDVAVQLPGWETLRYRKTNVRPGGADYEPIACWPVPERGPLEMAAYNGDAPFHPCQKPLPIMSWLVGIASDAGDTVVDPFAGSGSTLRAAKDMGRACIGIEREERYCEIAAKRLAQEVLL